MNTEPHQEFNESERKLFWLENSAAPAVHVSETAGTVYRTYSCFLMFSLSAFSEAFMKPTVINIYSTYLSTLEIRGQDSADVSMIGCFGSVANTASASSCI